MDLEDEKIIMSYACWFVNTFWNGMYDDASVSFKESDDDQIIENYKIILSSFNQAFKSDAPIKRRHDTPYGSIMEDICKYYNKYCYRNKNIRQFILATAEMMIGKGEIYEQKLDYDEVDNIVKNVMREILSNFIVYVLTDNISEILTRNEEIPLRWRDKFLKIFEIQINKYKDHVMALKNGVDLTNGNNIETVPLAVVDTLKNKIKELLYDKEKLILEYNQLVRYTSAIKSTLKKLQTQQINQNNMVLEEMPENSINIEEEYYTSDSGDIFSYDE